jgi:hypothetical protein
MVLPDALPDPKREAIIITGKRVAILKVLRHQLKLGTLWGRKLGTKFQVVSELRFPD